MILLVTAVTAGFAFVLACTALGGVLTLLNHVVALHQDIATLRKQVNAMMANNQKLAKKHAKPTGPGR